MVPPLCFSVYMAEEALIRLENLRRLRLSPTDLSTRVGGRYTYWRDLLGGKKSFGEKIARKIEDKLSLPRGSLDEDSGVKAPLRQALHANSLTEHMVALEIALDGLPPILQVSGRDVLAKWVRGELDARKAAADLDELARMGAIAGEPGNALKNGTAI